MVRPLHMEPGDKLEFKGSLTQPLSQELRIRNKTGKRQGWKLKSSDKTLFKIRPAIGFVKHGATATATVTMWPRAGGGVPSGSHHISLYETPAKITDTKDLSPHQLWSRPQAQTAKAQKPKKKLPVEIRSDKPPSQPRRRPPPAPARRRAL